MIDVVAPVLYCLIRSLLWCLDYFVCFLLLFFSSFVCMVASCSSVIFVCCVILSLCVVSSFFLLFVLCWVGALFSPSRYHGWERRDYSLLTEIYITIYHIFINNIYMMYVLYDMI